MIQVFLVQLITMFELIIKNKGFLLRLWLPRRLRPDVVL